MQLPSIIETPNHFLLGSVDLLTAVGDNQQTKVEKLGDGVVKVTKSFIAKDYKYQDNDDMYSSLYDFDHSEK